MPVASGLVQPRRPVLAGLHANALVPSISGTEMRVVVPAEATAGAYAVWLNISAPGASPPRHIHHREDEVIHVLEGRLAIWIDGQLHEAAPGDTASLPRDVAHTFRVISDTPAHMLMTVVPGGFERFFAAVSGLVVPRDIAEVARISGEYELEIVGPPLQG